MLEGGNVRHGLNKDLGFSEDDPKENIRRVAEVAKLMVDMGLVSITSSISPFESDRQMARGLFENDESIEVFIKTSLEICEARDPKGLYAKARRGELKGFTGIDSLYMPPSTPELSINTEVLSLEGAVDVLMVSLGLVSVQKNKND